MVDRIDFTDTGVSVLVIKFVRQEEAHDIPISNDQKPADFDLEAALSWCEEHGWTVRRWPGGARAWKGTPWPIRTRWQIRKKRMEVERLAMRGYFGDANVIGLDFALDM